MLCFRVHLDMLMLFSPVPTSPPQNARGVSVNSTFILLTWEPPVRDGHNGIITSYYIHILEVPTSRTFTFERPSHTDLLIGSLHPYYDYQCSVAANTSVGRGPFTAPFIIRTDQDGKCRGKLKCTLYHTNVLRLPVMFSKHSYKHVHSSLKYFSCPPFLKNHGMILKPQKGHIHNQ